MALRAALAAFREIGSVQSNWSTFIDTLVEAHETDLKSRGGGLSDKDMKPGDFDNHTITKQKFSQWADDFYSWSRKVDKSYKEMLKVVADMKEWNETKFEDDLELENEAFIQEGLIKRFDDDINDMLRMVTAGDARDIVDAAKSAAEAWWRLNERYYSKTSQGATAVADRIQATKRPASINEANNKLTALKKLLKEFDRQSPLEKLPSSVVKSALCRVLPESYHKTLTFGVTLETAQPGTVEERILQIIRDSTSGPAAMDLSNMGKGNEDEAEKHETNQHQHQGDWQGGSAEQWAQQEQQQDPTGAYALTKGKGKGKGGKSEFQGYCDNPDCRAWGHTWRYCPKGKGKGKGGKGYQGGKGWKGEKGKGKGYRKGMNNFEQSWDNQSWDDWSGYGGVSSLNVLEFDRHTETHHETPSMNEVTLKEQLEIETNNGEWKVPVKVVKPKGALKGRPRDAPASVVYIADAINDFHNSSNDIFQPPKTF